jgi:hypothetical protein
MLQVAAKSRFFGVRQPAEKAPKIYQFSALVTTGRACPRRQFARDPQAFFSAPSPILVARSTKNRKDRGDVARNCSGVSLPAA